MRRRAPEITAFWGVYREVKHSPGRETDDAAILEATGRRLEESGSGFAVAYRAPGSLGARERGLPDLIFAMCEGPPALEVLSQWERRGVCVVNDARAVANTHRERSMRLLEDGRIPVPESLLLECGAPVPRGEAEARLFAACWVKQAAEHKTREGDVRFASDAASVEAALEHLRARGLMRAVVQRHIEGDMVKFYGVSAFDAGAGESGTDGPAWFRWFHPKEHPVSGHAFDAAALRDVARRAARALGLDVWGGDAIVTPRGEIFVIDLNAWPSFALYRDEAADHIAAHLAARWRRLARVAV